MKRVLTSGIVMMVVGVAHFGCSSTATPAGGDAGGGGAANTVTLVNNAFSPATLTIKAGQTVTWTWQNGVHDVKSGANCTADRKFDSGAPVAAPKTFEFKFDTPGSYEYFCTPHCQSTNMKGTIVVQ